MTILRRRDDRVSNGRIGTEYRLNYIAQRAVANRYASDTSQEFRAPRRRYRPYETSDEKFSRNYDK